MKANTTQREILLVNGASSSSQEFSETDEIHNYNCLTETQKLEIACRNNLVLLMLPEIFEEHSVNKKLHIHKMRKGALFIEVKFGEIHLKLEMEFSIDPYAILVTRILS